MLIGMSTNRHEVVDVELRVVMSRVDIPARHLPVVTGRRHHGGMGTVHTQDVVFMDGGEKFRKVVLSPTYISRNRLLLGNVNRYFGKTAE